MNRFSDKSSPENETLGGIQSGFCKEGQVKKCRVEPVVIGGMVLDVNATSSIHANPRTTTPGKVIFSLGGVARNVADCISKLEARPFMISAVGFDLAGNMLLEHWESAGLSIEGIQRHQNIETAVVCHIFDQKGEVAAGVAHVESIEKFLTPRWIEKFKCKISSTPILMVDANLNSSSLEASCQMAAQFNTPVWFEPVSVAKSRRIASVVQYVTFASPNEDELVAMANAISGRDIFQPIRHSSTKLSKDSFFQMLKPAISVLLYKGVKVVVVTLGSEGVLLCSKGKSNLQKLAFKENQPSHLSRELYEAVNTVCPRDQFFGASMCEQISNLFAVHFPALPASVVRLTGAGDCLVGGTIASLCAGLDVMQSVAVGIAAAKVVVEVESNVPDEYCLAKLADNARSVYSGATMLLSQSKL
ncbi:pseudouridine kinase [Lycium ferocissimum]|uniref:pseudouridine kinase n=1 Tax=Lycium ferocissimum TaxID=112874 RepID=UPI002814BF86|nr:pseudouridine kinase [Lycium ferocissimum]XP_059314175.1 pseudouridine kinase [Lycium ferocissimum]XP_059314177.1 pseudouridine kinase [Lycium ferocissimum]XP_059314178.1 pseudouridine kinase [Lycium ferocissimum]